MTTPRSATPTSTPTRTPDAIRPPTRVYWRRRLVALGGVALLAAAGVVAATRGSEPAARAGSARTTAAPAPVELPGGGRTILPDKRVVAFYGSPDDEQLGVLGIGSPRTAGRKLLRQARPYARKTRPVLPAFELLATIATADGGPDGMYRRHASNRTIRRYLRAAREIKALLVLDIQPGRANFVREVMRLERWLREPDVGLALDPEWRVQEGQVPGRVIGSVSAQEVNAVTDWLDSLVAKHALPQKLMVIHQFTDGMVRDKGRLSPRRHLAIVLNADGFGGRAVKKAKYHAFVKGPADFHDGFKLFYEEDVDLMRPAHVLRLRPPPDFIVYE